jgi:NTE family protein
VLDRLLEEEPWLEIEGISGTSAGAMNAAVLADGLLPGGREGARGALAFWRAVSDAARFSPFQRGPLDMLLGRWTLDNSPAYPRDGPDDAAVLALRPQPGGPTRSRHPAEDASISTAGAIPRSSSSSPPPTCAPAARASSATPTSRRWRCWPRPACRTLFQAVEIDGEPYWDGGYSGNPTMTPLVNECVSRTTPS